MELLAIDMDGTLLNRDWEISEENANMIKKAQEAGIVVAIASGRAYQDIVKVLHSKNLKAPVIAVNGAVIMNENGQRIVSVPIPKKTISELLELLTRRESFKNIYFEVYTDHKTYTLDTEKNRAHPDIQKHIEKTGVIRVPDLTKKVLEETTEVYKFLMYSFDRQLLQELGKQIEQFDQVAVSSSGSNNLEVTQAKAQKGIGLKKLADVLQIPIEQTAAIGDNYNDVSMFQMAGSSIAMGNATDEIQQMCTYVTKTNEENGVAYAIERFILI